jgi:hypothetical protein
MFSLSSPPAKFTFGCRTTSWRHCLFSIRRSLVEKSGYVAGDRVINGQVRRGRRQGPWDSSRRPEPRCRHRTSRSISGACWRARSART